MRGQEEARFDVEEAQRLEAADVEGDGAWEGGDGLDQFEYLERRRGVGEDRLQLAGVDGKAVPVEERNRFEAVGRCDEVFESRDGILAVLFCH